MWVFGIDEIVKTPEVKAALNEPGDALVDAEDTIETWQPEQHGNLVIAEPELMTLHRRGKL